MGCHFLTAGLWAAVSISASAQAEPNFPDEVNQSTPAQEAPPEPDTAPVNSRVWGIEEYLFWRLKRPSLPPLVTNSFNLTDTLPTTLINLLDDDGGVRLGNARLDVRDAIPQGRQRFLDIESARSIRQAA